MPVIRTEIEIACPPSEVRKIFFNFEDYPSWHHSNYIKSVKPLSADPAEAFSPSQKLHCTLDIYTFDAIITENSPGLFQWRGPPVQTVAGLHSFIFEESKVTPGATTFRQVEELSGMLSFLMHPRLMGKSIKEQFDGFNADLKKKAESVAAAGK